MITRAANRFLPLLLVLMPGHVLAAEEATLGLSNGFLENILWFLLPFVMSIVILASIERWIRALRRSLLRRRQLQHDLGGSPLLPLPISSFHEIASRRCRRCSCGKEPLVVYEGATMSQQRKLWLVIQICPHCETRRQTYFDVTDARDTRAMVTSHLTPTSQ